MFTELTATREKDFISLERVAKIVLKAYAPTSFKKKSITTTVTSSSSGLSRGYVVPT